MVGSLPKLGIGSGLGFLAGVAAVVWIAPTTTAGMVLVIAVCVTTGTTLSGIVAFVIRARRERRPP